MPSHHGRSKDVHRRGEPRAYGTVRLSNKDLLVVLDGEDWDILYRSRES